MKCMILNKNAWLRFVDQFDQWMFITDDGGLLVGQNIEPENYPCLAIYHDLYEGCVQVSCVYSTDVSFMVS